MIINEASLWKWLSLKLTERTGQTELADESTSCQLTVYLCFFFTLLMETTVWVQSTVCHGELFSLIFQLMVIYFWWMFKSFLLFWTQMTESDHCWHLIGLLIKSNCCCSHRWFLGEKKKKYWSNRALWVGLSTWMLCQPILIRKKTVKVDC